MRAAEEFTYRLGRISTLCNATLLCGYYGSDQLANLARIVGQVLIS